MTEPILLKPQQAAEVLGIGRSLIYLLIRDGKLPTVKVGNSLRVPRAALDQWVIDNTREAK